MADLLHNPPVEVVRPDYSIYRYTDQIYKIIRFRSTAPLGIKRDREKHQTYDHKLDASLSRSRRTILELALCNDWAYFCTFTIGGCRDDLETWYTQFTQRLRDLRKKFGVKIDYLLVPELHADGVNWHMHGLFSDITPLLVSFETLHNNGFDVPYKLVEKGFYDWLDYSQKFGFCSFDRPRNKVAVSFYITKYITKTLGKDVKRLGARLFYSSHRLNKATKHGEVYGNCSYLDKFLVNFYDFCDTGMTKVKDGFDWTFGFEYMDFSTDDEVLEKFDIEQVCSEVDDYWEVTQEVISGF